MPINLKEARKRLDDIAKILATEHEDPLRAQAIWDIIKNNLTRAEVDLSEYWSARNAQKRAREREEQRERLDRALNEMEKKQAPKGYTTLQENK